MSKKDKVRVEEFHFSVEQLESFFDKKSYDEAQSEFLMLETAYRSMRLPYFEQFLDLFVARGYDLNATNRDGETLLQTMQTHQSFQGYAQAISARLS